MLAVTIMKSVNDFLLGNGYMSIAVRETQNECAKIESARSVFLINNLAIMLDFVHAYNMLNDFNQIPHVVGSVMLVTFQ